MAHTGTGRSSVTAFFLHVRSGPDDPHAVLMALRMATLMVNERDVLVYFDLKGVQVVLNDAPDITFPTPSIRPEPHSRP